MQPQYFAASRGRHSGLRRAAFPLFARGGSMHMILKDKRGFPGAGMVIEILALHTPKRFGGAESHRYA
jgi:hypothetical protein